MTTSPLKTIAICGAGFSGILCAAALVKSLPEDIELLLIDIPGSNETDMFFGNVTSPAIYDFLLNIGITEPELLPKTNTTFSLGTRYSNWGKNQRSWIQSFHTPLPAFQGVAFHHYLTGLRNSIAVLNSVEPYIMSAQAADKGVFAHPPEDKKTPLSSVEYGYHFSLEEWSALISTKIKDSRIEMVSGEIKTVQIQDGQIRSITLTDEKTIEADFFIDCTGINSKIGQSEIQSERRLKAISYYRDKDITIPTCRTLTGTDFGWYSDTTLQDRQNRLTIYDPANEEIALSELDELNVTPIQAIIGYANQPWQANCLTLGHGAATLEPLTPAPIMLLQRDIERLIELIPHTDNMDVEAREYNRRFIEDYNHASMFQRGFFDDESETNSPYWQSAIDTKTSQKLANKITQFQSRGTVVEYDLEPFVREDWIQQHYGMGRLPRRHDPLADKADKHQIVQTLMHMRSANEALAAKMPPHHIYMKKLLEYIRKTHG